MGRIIVDMKVGMTTFKLGSKFVIASSPAPAILRHM